MEKPVRGTFLAIIAAMTLVFGAAAGALDLDLDTSKSGEQPDNDFTLTGDTGVYATDTPLKSYYELGEWDVGDNILVIGDDSAGNDVGTDLVSISFSELTVGDNGTLAVTELGNVSIDNAMIFIGTDGATTANYLQVLGGQTHFAEGLTLAGAGALTTTGGTITTGTGEYIFVTEAEAVDFDVSGVANGNYILNLDNVVIDNRGVLGDKTFLYNGFTADKTGTVNIDALDIQAGGIDMGAANTAFNVAEQVLLGGVLTDDETSYRQAMLRVGDEGGEVTFNQGIYIGADGRLQAVDSDNDQTGTVTINVGAAATATEAAVAGDIILDGSFLDLGYAQLYSTEGVTLQFLDKAGNSKLRVIGAQNSIQGIIDTGTTAANRMDMAVDLSNADGATPANPLLAGFTERYGDKYSGYLVIGNDYDNLPTTLSVGNYTQSSGIVLGYGTLLDTIAGDPNDDSIDIYGVTTVTGGVFAMQANVNGDMTFTGSSLNRSDRTMLLGIGQTITNASAAMSDDNTFSALTLTIGDYAAQHMEVFGMTTVDLSTVVNSRGDVVFGTTFGIADAPVNVLNVDTANLPTGQSISYTAKNSGSIKFSDSFLKSDFNTTNPVILVQTDDDATDLDIASTSFDGLYGAFETAVIPDPADTDREVYALVDYGNTTGVTWDGTADDFARANAKLRQMYGAGANRGMNLMIYKSGVDAATGADPYAGLEMIANATDAQRDSYNLNLANLQNFAQGRSEAGSAFNLYSGNAVNGVNMVSQAVARSHIRTAMNRSNEIRQAYNMAVKTVSGGDGLASSIMNACYTNRFWVGGFGLWEDADARKGMAGYKYKSYGFVTGYDRLIGSNLILGGSFAYNRGDFEDKAAIAHDSDIDNYSFNIYGTYSLQSGFFGTLFAGYTYSDNDINETYVHDLNKPARNNADYHTKTWVVGGKVGYDWRPAERLTLTPSVGFTYIHARSSAHTEYAGNTIVGRYGKMSDAAAYVPVELSLGYDAWVGDDSKLNLNLDLGYAYNFDEDGVSGAVFLDGFNNGNPYRASSRDQGHHLFNIGAGTTYTKGRWDFGVQYDYYRQAKADTHRVMGNIGIKF